MYISINNILIYNIDILMNIYNNIINNYINISIKKFFSLKKEIANHTFCIENILFFESYCDLMNMVISFYNKKTNSVMNENSNY